MHKHAWEGQVVLMDLNESFVKPSGGRQDYGNVYKDLDVEYTGHFAPAVDDFFAVVCHLPTPQEPYYVGYDLRFHNKVDGDFEVVNRFLLTVHKVDNAVFRWRSAWLTLKWREYQRKNHRVMEYYLNSRNFMRGYIGWECNSITAYIRMCNAGLIAHENHHSIQHLVWRDEGMYERARGFATPSHHSEYWYKSGSYVEMLAEYQAWLVVLMLDVPRGGGGLRIFFPADQMEIVFREYHERNYGNLPWSDVMEKYQRLNGGRTLRMNTDEYALEWLSTPPSAPFPPGVDVDEM
jgi:hypothetical protein